MVYIPSPCHHCKDRTETCHAKCKRYAEYKLDVEAFRLTEREYKERYDDNTSMTMYREKAFPQKKKRGK